ncbi:MarR family winged helix-turn-helix transcriptional regulator [Saccharospirillum impatiens]|uniref:MarR family winged helix-turn-helix transcriptional regulator n=1 Tax=Saccharospirillum impatiens TaxID=169438 RepID=UPI000426AFD9|nr:MarR family transcriptional regulator [Saccharospirillum impatiens]
MSEQATTPNRHLTSKEHLRLWLRLLRTTRRVEADLRERLRLQFNTTLPRFDVMAALSRHPDGLKMNELSQQLKVSNGNVTGIISRLVEDGWVERIAIEGDRRATRVLLTAAGNQQFHHMAQAHEHWVDELFSSLSGQETHHMNELFAHLPTEAGPEPDSPAPDNQGELR